VSLPYNYNYNYNYTYNYNYNYNSPYPALLLGRQVVPAEKAATSRRTPQFSCAPRLDRHFRSHRLLPASLIPRSRLARLRL
jgi:hypothetical protein